MKTALMAVGAGVLILASFNAGADMPPTPFQAQSTPQPKFTTSSKALTDKDLKWESVGIEDGIEISKADVPGSAIVAFKGAGIIDAPPAKVLSVILDTARAQEWIEDLVESKNLKWIQEPLAYVEYNMIDTPWVMRDRYFVSALKMAPNLSTGVLEVWYETPPEEAEDLIPQTAEVKRSIRGDLTGSGFRLHPKEGGKTTYIEGWAIADPKGEVPKWIVNLFQSAWPRKVFEALKKQVGKPDIKEHPRFLQIFAKSSYYSKK